MAGTFGCCEVSMVRPGPATRGSVPVVANFAASISQPEADRLKSLAGQLLANEPALASTEVFGPGVRAGMCDGPALVIGDHREVALTTPRDAAIYEYRLSHLAADGDMLLLSDGRNGAFERYREETLGLGAMEVVSMPASGRDGGTPLALRCLNHAEAFDTVAGSARGAGGLTILPYIGMGSAWVLAGAIAERAGVNVRVAAPPPRLTRRVNDKVWFSHRVAEVLGAQAQPRYRSVYGPAALAAHVALLAKRSEKVAVKVPDSAGSAGNICLESAAIRGRTPKALRANLRLVLGGMGWRGRFPLLVEVWDTPVLANPSIQTWIPDLRDGPPVLEAMFEQIIAGPEGEFVGSLPTSLPARWTATIMEQAFRLAVLFQHLGFFGRCSFDAVVAGRDLKNAVLHWIECNGRWGGVSIPMTLVNRLTGNWARQAMVVVQIGRLGFSGRPFSEVLGQMDASLYRPGMDGRGLIFLSPAGIERGSSINLAAIAQTAKGARTLSEKAVAALKAHLRPA